MPVQFIVRRTVTPLYYGVLKTAEGETLIRTQMHHKKQDCLRDIDFMTHHSSLSDLIVTRQDSSGDHFLLLQNKDNRILAFSEPVKRDEQLRELLTRVLQSIQLAHVVD